MFVERWRAQLKDMDDEDNEFQVVMRNKIYPNGLFNLTSNPLFSIYSLTRKLKAINTILSSERNVKNAFIPTCTITLSILNLNTICITRRI